MGNNTFNCHRDRKDDGRKLFLEIYFCCKLDKHK